MNNKTLVKLSNTIGIISIILLVYWVFVFISITVFGLKVFRENITETFYLSVIGILALMLGALIVNVMFNLTRIAEKHNNDGNAVTASATKRGWIIFAISFPVIFVFLFAGDHLTAQKKERMLISSAKSLVEANPAQAKHLFNYRFDRNWINKTHEILELLANTDENFQNVSVIVADSILGTKTFLTFKNYSITVNDTVPPAKKDYIQKTTKEEREYLDKVFRQDLSELRFSAHDGNYELFYPYSRNGRKVVLYFSEYQRYGKIGS